MLAGVLEFQRDMISENTKEGVAAAAASGKTLGRPAALGEDEAAQVITAYREGAAVKALARRYGVAPKTIRRALDAADARDLAGAPALPDGAADAAQHSPEPGTTVVLDMPGLLADHLQASPDAAVRDALHGGRPSRPERGNGLGKRAGSFSFWAVKSCSGSSVTEEIIRQWTSVVTDAGGLLELRVSSALDRRHPRGLSSRLDPGRAHRNRRRSIRTPQFTKPKPNHANRPAPASGDVPHQPIAPFRLTWSAPVLRCCTSASARARAKAAPGASS